MLASRTSEYHSLFKYFNVTYIVLIIVLLNGINRTAVLAAEQHQIETETKFASEHIEKSCIEKCPDQVSGPYYSNITNHHTQFIFVLSYPRVRKKIIIRNFWSVFFSSLVSVSFAFKLTKTKFYRSVSCGLLHFSFIFQKHQQPNYWHFLFSPASLYMHELSDLLFVCLLKSNWFN